MDKIFSALSSKPRRLILSYLAGNELSAGQIAERFEMSQPAISKHLKILEDADLVKSEKKGQFVLYHLTEKKLTNTLHNFMAELCPDGRVVKHEIMQEKESK